MVDTLSRYLSTVKDFQAAQGLRFILSPLVDGVSCQSLISATIVPSAGATTTKVGAVDWYGTALGLPVKVAATTVLPALAGTIAQNFFGSWSYFVDSAGVVTAVFGTQGANLAAMKFALRPIGKALMGHSIFNPTTAAFIGGTTLADAANTNHVGINSLGYPLDQTSLVG